MNMQNTFFTLIFFLTTYHSAVSMDFRGCVQRSFQSLETDSHNEEQFEHFNELPDSLQNHIVECAWDEVNNANNFEQTFAKWEYASPYRYQETSLLEPRKFGVHGKKFQFIFLPLKMELR